MRDKKKGRRRSKPLVEEDTEKVIIADDDVETPKLIITDNVEPTPAAAEAETEAADKASTQVLA